AKSLLVGVLLDDIVGEPVRHPMKGDRPHQPIHVFRGQVLWLHQKDGKVLGIDVSGPPKRNGQLVVGLDLLRQHPDVAVFDAERLIGAALDVVRPHPLAAERLKLSEGFLQSRGRALRLSGRRFGPRRFGFRRRLGCRFLCHGTFGHCWPPRGWRGTVAVRFESEGHAPQLTAFFTSATILASSAAVNAFSAKVTGHMAPSSRFAASLKPNDEYLVLNFCALWKKQTTLPSLAYAGIPYQSLGERTGALVLMSAWSRSHMARSGWGIAAIFASTAL